MMPLVDFCGGIPGKSASLKDEVLQNQRNLSLVMVIGAKLQKKKIWYSITT
jgi:hypothetical protein